MHLNLVDKGRKLGQLNNFHKGNNAVLFEGFSADEREQAFNLLLRLTKRPCSALYPMRAIS